jgi:hypothetical protein
MKLWLKGKLARLTGVAAGSVKPVEATIIEPSPEQIDRGIANLKSCLPHWRQTPGLLVIKPACGLIVSVAGSAHDGSGFALTLDIVDRLVSPKHFDRTGTTVRYGWNQPYASFGPDLISAPYSFYLHFGAEGVNKAREVVRRLPPTLDPGAGGDLMLGLLRGCFPP